MKTVFQTESGSVYEIDHSSMTWAQSEAGADRGPLALRTDSGVILQVGAIKQGQSVYIVGPALRDGFAGRLIITSPVISLEITE